MARILALVVGPEVYWLVLYFGFRWLAARNVPPTAQGNGALEWATWLAAALGVPLSFAFYSVPGTNRWALLGRLALAGFVGLNACAIVACDAIKYPEPGRNSGLMGLWIMAVLLGGVIFVMASAVALFVLRKTASAV